MTDTTETPMRERIARAIRKDLDVPQSIWKDYLDTADAVLDAMREPSFHMADVAARKGAEIQGYPLDDVTLKEMREAQNTAKEIWRAMIDAAKEGK